MSEVEKNVEVTAEAQVQPEVQAETTNQEGPLTEEELKQNQLEEDRKTMRVLQIVQHEKGQRIEIHPIQNIKFRSDIIGILIQALNNIQNEDIMRNDAALLRETISIIKTEQPQS